MKTKKLLLATGTALTLLMTNLPSLAEVVNQENLNFDAYPVDTNVNVPDKAVDEDKLSDIEIKAIIKIINETNNQDLKNLLVKVLKKFYNDLKDEQKDLIKEGIKDKEIFKKITEKKLLKPTLDSQLEIQIQPNLIP